MQGTNLQTFTTNAEQAAYTNAIALEELVYVMFQNGQDEDAIRDYFEDALERAVDDGGT